MLLELGKIVLLLKAWRAVPSDAELRRAVSTSETRDSLLENPEAMKVSSHWEVIGEEISTRRDGLVSQATWLLNLADGRPSRFCWTSFQQVSARDRVPSSRVSNSRPS